MFSRTYSRLIIPKRIIAVDIGRIIACVMRPRLLTRCVRLMDNRIKNIEANFRIVVNREQQPATYSINNLIFAEFSYTACIQLVSKRRSIHKHDSLKNVYMQTVSGLSRNGSMLISDDVYPMAISFFDVRSTTIPPTIFITIIPSKN